MQEMVTAGEDVLVFYNDKSSFNTFLFMQKKYRNQLKNQRYPVTTPIDPLNCEDPDEAICVLRYHVELVRLLAYCTMGKNVFTEIKCHSLLPLDDIIKMVCHEDTIPEVRLPGTFS